LNDLFSFKSLELVYYIFFSLPILKFTLLVIALQAHPFHWGMWIRSGIVWRRARNNSSSSSDKRKRVSTSTAAAAARR